MLTGAKMTCFFRVRIQALTEMTHTGSRRETLTSDLPSSVHRESRCYSNHITNSERRGLLHMASRSMALIGPGTWMASSPKFLALRVLLAPTAKTHGCNCTAEGMFSICRISGVLVLEDRLRPPKAFWISGVRSGNWPFEGAVPSNSEQGWFCTSLTWAWIPIRKNMWKGEQLSLYPLRAIAPSLPDTLARCLIFLQPPHLSIHSLPQEEFLSARRLVFFLRLVVYFYEASVLLG